MQGLPSLAIKSIGKYYRNRQLWYVPIVGVAMILMMTRPLFIAHLLSNKGFAYYSAGLLISSTFCMLGCLGLQPLLQREMPVQLVRGRERAALLLLSQCVLVALICLIGGLILIAGGLRLAGLSAEIAAISILHGFSQQAFLLSTVESRSRGNPLRFAQQSLVRSVLVLTGMIASAIAFKSAGKVLLAEALISIIISYRFMAQAYKKASVPVLTLITLALSRFRLIPWRKAISLLMVMVVGFGLINLDRWLAASFLDASVFAQYAFAWIVVSVAQSSQVIINALIYPLLARRFATYGRSGSFKLASLSSAAILISGTVIFWPCLEIVHLVVPNFFPQYQSSLELMEVLMFVALIRVSDFWTSYLIITGKEFRLLVIQVVVALAVLLGWLAVVRPWVGGLSANDIVILALCTTISNYAVVLCLSIFNRR